VDKIVEIIKTTQTETDCKIHTQLWMNKILMSYFKQIQVKMMTPVQIQILKSINQITKIDWPKLLWDSGQWADRETGRTVMSSQLSCRSPTATIRMQILSHMDKKIRMIARLDLLSRQHQGYWVHLTKIEGNRKFWINWTIITWIIPAMGSKIITTFQHQARMTMIQTL